MKKLVVLAIVTLFITASAFSQGRGTCLGMGPGPRMNNMIEKLNLTADQKAKFDKFLSEHQKKMIDLRADLSKKRIDMKDMADGNLNRKEIVAKTEEMNKAHNTIALERASFLANVSEILTDAQKKEVKNLLPGFRNGQGMNRNMRGKGRMNQDCPYNK